MLRTRGDISPQLYPLSHGQKLTIARVLENPTC